MNISKKYSPGDNAEVDTDAVCLAVSDGGRWALAETGAAKVCLRWTAALW